MLRLRRIQAVPGKTDHCTDLTLDIAAVSDAAPAQVLDRVGNDHLTRVGMLEVAAHVVTAPVAPQSIPDSVTGAAADELGRVGSPTVVVRDTSVDGRKTYGLQGAGATNHLITAGGFAGVAGAPWWVAYYGRPDALLGPPCATIGE